MQRSKNGKRPTDRLGKATWPGVRSRVHRDRKKTCGVTLPPDVSFGYFGSGEPGRSLTFYLFQR